MRRWIFFILLFFTLEAHTQVLKTSLPFSTATPYIEPDGRKLTLKLNDAEFVLLSKVKGHLHGESSYQLEKYDKDLGTKFKTPLICPGDEDFKEMFFNGTDIILFSVIHDEVLKKSKLMAYSFDLATGVKKADKVLQERTVADWMEVQGKGAVKTNFDNEICSTLAKHFTTNFEYQYQIKYSPDKSKILVYIFDYGQKNLQAEIKIFDNKLNELQGGIIPIDNGFINYGIYPNNKGDIYILNSERTGRIVVINYNLKTKGSKLLDIQNASTNRSSLNLQVFTDNEVYISCINTAANKLAGVMYAKFDFKQNTIEKLNFHDISVGLQQTVQIMRPANKNLSGQESWLNYEIVNFHVNEYEKIILVLEKREITGVGFTYNNLSINNPKNWGEKTVKVNTEGIFLFSFNKDDELLWENFYEKSQVNDASMGMTGSSFAYDVTDDGRIRMFYPSYENSTGTYNIINYVEWDELTGNKTKEMKAPNDEGVSMITDYTVWWEDRVLVVGRKGILGKKSFMQLYKLEVN
jgi:hypothetical protein